MESTDIRRRSTAEQVLTSAAPDAIPLTISAAARALRAGELSSVSLTESAISRADRLDGALGVYLTRIDDAAREAASRADAELAAGIDRGPLHGIPLGVKDILRTADAPTTAMSVIVDPSFNDGTDAPAVRRLREAGAVITGKTTTMEFAVGNPDPAKPFPTPRNPWNLSHWAGGSSSGSASGVAAGLFLGALGTDTAGSIRCPAAWNGISGMKPTYGRVPKPGCIPLGLTFDNIGPFTRTARDIALMLTVIAGGECGDPTSSFQDVPDYTAALTGQIDGLRVGFDFSLLDGPTFDKETAQLVRACLAVFESGGAELVDLRLPWYDELVTATLMGFSAEALAYHRKDLQDRWFDYGGPTRMAFAGGIAVTGSDYVQLQRVRRVGVKAMRELFDDVDIVLTSTCSGPAPDLRDLDWDSLLGIINTPYWDAVGNPTISIPAGRTSAGMPVGLQMSGAHFDEATVLRAADFFQTRTDYHIAESPIVTGMLA